MTAVIAVSILFLLLTTVALMTWIVFGNKAQRNNPSRGLINSIKIKEEEDNLNEMLKFLKQNPNIKYDIRRNRND